MFVELLLSCSDFPFLLCATYLLVSFHSDVTSHVAYLEQLMCKSISSRDGMRPNTFSGWGSHFTGKSRDFHIIPHSRLGIGPGVEQVGRCRDPYLVQDWGSGRGWNKLDDAATDILCNDVESAGRRRMVDGEGLSRPPWKEWMGGDW